MADGTSAAHRLQRLLYVLPAAARPGGASLAGLADALGTSPGRIAKDLTEVAERSFYHPGGWPDDILIFIEADRVRVLHPGGMERPARLTPLESLCLAIGLRGTTAASYVEDPGARETLLERVERHLTTPGAGAGGVGAIAEAYAAADLRSHASDDTGIREEVLWAARRRVECAIIYAKPGATDTEPRAVRPYAVVYAEGSWYVVAHCLRSNEVRVFRTDRILEASRTDRPFVPPADFDVKEYLREGSVYHAPEGDRVRIRYAPRIARWIRERSHFKGWVIEEDADGAVVLEHTVADPQWVVSHTLQYGADAEVIAPPEYRELVRSVGESMA